MSLLTEMQDATAEAYGNLAQLSGMAATAAGNTLFAGETAPCTMVYGKPSVQWLPLISGGYRKRTVVVAKIARTLRATPPAPNTKLARIDLAPAVTYNIDHVDTQDALAYTLTLINQAG